MTRLVSVLMVSIALAGYATRPAQPPQVRLPPPPPTGEPAGTTGLHEADLRAQFGMPGFVRHDGSAQIWRFDEPACKAYFFLSSRDAATAVWHVETAPRGANIAADEACLNALRARVAP